MGVAVSGGSDSLALLHAIHAWGGAEARAVSVDHGLRPAAASEILHVAHLCERLGVPHDVLRWEGWDGRGNLQDQARRTRYAMLAEWAAGQGIDVVALGHTRDDQAETVLMRLGRAAGVDGLSAMAPHTRRHGTVFVRPLLGAARAELRDALTEIGVRWVDDPTNDDLAFERTRVRQALATLAPLGITPEALADVAANMTAARAALSDTAATAVADIATVEAGDVVFDRTALRRRPAEIGRRLLAGALRWVAAADYTPRRDAMAAATDAIAAGQNTALHGCLVRPSAMTVRITREPAATAPAAATDALWDGRWRLDGPHAPDLTLAALGDAVLRCPDWRATRLPRLTLCASPAVWRGSELVAAPLAGLAQDWRVAAGPHRDDFAASLLAH